MEWIKHLFLIIGFDAIVTSVDFNCKGAKLKVNYIRNCHDGEHIITILDNSTINMNDNCEIFSYMCAYIEPYHHATFEVSITKDENPHFDDKVDLCHKPKKAHDLSQIAMSAFSVPYICPVVSNYTSCGNGKKIFSDTETSKNVVEQLWTEGGMTKIYADILHNSGKSCMEAEIQIIME